MSEESGMKSEEKMLWHLERNAYGVLVLSDADGTLHEGVEAPAH